MYKSDKKATKAGEASVFHCFLIKEQTTFRVFYATCPYSARALFVVSKPLTPKVLKLGQRHLVG